MEEEGGDHFGSHRALPVPDGEPDWETDSPQTAEEYLKRVRWEAASCEQITRSVIDTTQFEAKQTSYVPRVKTVADAPGFCQPTMTWILQTLKDFHKLHEHFEKVSADDDEDLPMGVPFVVNRVEGEEHARRLEEGLENLKNGIPPEMDAIAALDQVEALQSVKAHIGAFLKVKKFEDVSDVRCYWLYALLSRIHHPLHDTSAAFLRSLFKHCSHLRANYGKKWPSLSSEAQAQLEQSGVLPRLNLLLVLSGVYFGQDEKMCGRVELEDLDPQRFLDKMIPSNFVWNLNGDMHNMMSEVERFVHARKYCQLVEEGKRNGFHPDTNWLTVDVSGSLPLDGVFFVDSVRKSNSALAASPAGDSVSWPLQNAIEIHS